MVGREKPRCKRSVVDLQGDIGSLPASALSLARQPARLAVVELPALEREHDAAVKRRRLTQARRARCGLMSSRIALLRLMNGWKGSLIKR
jgi:hypothetical protein